MRGSSGSRWTARPTRRSDAGQAGAAAREHVARRGPRCPCSRARSSTRDLVAVERGAAVLRAARRRRPRRRRARRSRSRPGARGCGRPGPCRRAGRGRDDAVLLRRAVAAAGRPLDLVVVDELVEDPAQPAAPSASSSSVSASSVIFDAWARCIAHRQENFSESIGIVTYRKRPQRLVVASDEQDSLGRDERRRVDIGVEGQDQRSRPSGSSA